MINITDHKAILALTRCGDLFSRDRSKLDDEYRKLVKVFHPDRCKEPWANDVFVKITELYRQAEELLAQGKWEISNTVEFHLKDGKTYNVKYLTEHDFELGKTYIGRNNLWYVFAPSNRKYFDNAVKRMKSFQYVNDGMKKDLSRTLPNLKDSFETTEGEFVLHIDKPADVLYLKDVITYFNGNLPERHAAWMVSRLHNISCYLDFYHLSHNGISLDNVFICPEFHQVVLLGGWWYAVEQGSKLIGTQRQIYDIMPIKSKTDKVGDIVTDLESIKLISRQLFSNINTVPDAIKHWMNGGSAGKATEEFQKWDEALDKSWPRKFIKLELSVEDIYKK